jgi:hypothetical protein
MSAFRFLPLFSLVMLPTPLGGSPLAEPHSPAPGHLPDVQPQSGCDQNGMSSSRSS